MATVGCMHNATSVAKRLSARHGMFEEERRRVQQKREEIIENIVEEVSRRKEAWEAERQMQLSALRALQAQTLAIVGEGQKRAACVELAERHNAKESAATWKEWAEQALHRQRVALARAAAKKSEDERARAHDQAVYRREVTKAASLQTRRLVRRERNQNESKSPPSRSPSPPHVSSLGAGTRMSEFFGPHARDGIKQYNTTDDTVVTVSLNRNPQGGNPSCTSQVRTPLTVVRQTERSRSKSPSARILANKERQTLAAKREAAGEVEKKRASEALAREKEAGAELRVSREGMYLLQEMQRLDSLSRGLSPSSRSRSPSHLPIRSSSDVIASVPAGMRGAPFGVPYGPGGPPLQHVNDGVRTTVARDAFNTNRMVVPDLSTVPVSDNELRVPSFPRSEPAARILSDYVEAQLPERTRTSVVTDARLLHALSEPATEEPRESAGAGQRTSLRQSKWSYSLRGGLVPPPVPEDDPAHQAELEQAFATALLGADFARNE